MKYEQHFQERLSSLKIAVADDEKNVSLLEAKYSKLKRSYEQEVIAAKSWADTVFHKGIIVFICTLIVFLIDCFTGLASDSPSSLFIIPILGIVIYNILVWEDRSFRNEHEKNVSSQKYEYEQAEKSLLLSQRDLDKHKQELSSLQKEYLSWKNERSKILSDISGMKPFEYFDFPLDPVIDNDYYPIGTSKDPKKYIVFVANGYRFHKEKGCSGARKEISVFKAIDNKKTPCQLCYQNTDNLIFPDWLYTVHQKYWNFWCKLDSHDIDSFIDSEQQFNITIPKNQWELDVLSSIKRAWQDIHDIKVSLDLPIIKDTFDVHLAAMLNGLSRIIMYDQFCFLALEEELQNRIINLIDSYFLESVDMPNNYFYFSCSDFYQNSFPIWFENKAPHAYWYDDYFRSEYVRNKDKPLLRTMLSILASFGDIILSEQLSKDYDLLESYFSFNAEDEKCSNKYMSTFRNDFMIPTTKIVGDYFDIFWDYMQCCHRIEEIT